MGTGNQIKEHPDSPACPLAPEDGTGVKSCSLFNRGRKTKKPHFYLRNGVFVFIACPLIVLCLSDLFEI